MVDVSDKDTTRRVAEASCRVLLSGGTVRRLEKLPKGDALTVARVAGVQAAKSTATWCRSLIRCRWTRWKWRSNPAREA